MITNVQEIDLDSLFGPDAHIPSGDTSYVNDLDIDQAINNALAEIDQTTKTTTGFYSSTPYEKPLIKDYQSPYTPSHYQQQMVQVKPLSPASLLSDDSRSPQTPSISEYELLKLRELYEQKCKDLDITIMELKKSEKKRFLLMKENKQLKETVVKLSMDL